MREENHQLLQKHIEFERRQIHSQNEKSQINNEYQDLTQKLDSAILENTKLNLEIKKLNEKNEQLRQEFENL